MNDTRQSLEAQLANVAESLRLITERKSEYVEATSIPLDLVKNERECWSGRMTSSAAWLSSRPTPSAPTAPWSRSTWRTRRSSLDAMI